MKKRKAVRDVLVAACRKNLTLHEARTARLKQKARDLLDTEGIYSAEVWVKAEALAKAVLRYR